MIKADIYNSKINGKIWLFNNFLDGKENNKLNNFLDGKENLLYPKLCPPHIMPNNWDN